MVADGGRLLRREFDGEACAWAAAGLTPAGKLSRAGGLIGKAVNGGDNARDGSRAARGCNSFVPGTRVLMADGGSKPIEDIEVGEQVWATDSETGEESPRTVTATLTGSGIKHFATLTLTTDDGDITTLSATAGHRFWVANENRWSTAGELEHGNQLDTVADERLDVVAIDTSTELDQVHTLTVSGFHTYYVSLGGDSALVHNSNCDLKDVDFDNPRTFDPQLLRGRILKEVESAIPV